MVYSNDWLMFQILSYMEAVGRVAFGKGPVSHEEYLPPEVIELHLYIKKLLEDGKINEAENFLFEKMTAGDLDVLSVALSFYSTINDMDDDKLELNGFSREEIYQGVTDITKIYGLELPFIDPELI